MGDYGPKAARLALWLANGTLPNSVPGRFESYQLATYGGRKDLFAWSSVVNKGQNYIAIATSGDVRKFPEQFISLSAYFARFNAPLECLGSSGSFKEAIETREASGFS
jgi:hypothetical protein